PVGRPVGVVGLQSPCARLHRHGQVGNLRAGVVVVVLALDAPSAGGKQTRHAVAQGGVATVADVQRAGGVGRDEFDAHGAAFAARVVAIVAFGVQNVPDLGMVGRRGQKE